ncbi:MAG: elongation factor 4 [Planctomycetes bacterium]|nr:elongation factor 4 [Planctomycetota bacterium]
MNPQNIRNFSIIAHIDHGKSSLADRMLLHTGMVTQREFHEQLLDDMDIERERGITIKARSVAMTYRRPGFDPKDPQGTYLLNLIDTPGHVDFNYEVSRSLAACEGALLVVDATQGIEAQTIANAYLALEHDLKIIPVVNKIDLPSAMPEAICQEIVEFLGCAPEEVLYASAKTGQGIEDILEAIVGRIPPPAGKVGDPLRALVFDSVYDDYRGVIGHVRVVEGTVRRGDKVRLVQKGLEFEATELGTFLPKLVQRESLSVGEVGYFVGNIKELSAVKVGDTLARQGEAVEPLPGYSEPKSMVYCGLYPSNSENFDDLRKALEKLALNDSSFTFTPETSVALGFGYRCGFLGMLHMEIIHERLERESDLDLIMTAPNVTYEILLSDGKTIYIHSAAEVPDPSRIASFREPIVSLQVMVPKEFVGTIMTLAEERRAVYKSMEYIGPHRVLLHYEVPFAEIVYDFYDVLKGATRGYGTMDFEFLRYQEEDLCKLDILVHGNPVDALSVVCLKSQATRRGRAVLQKLRKEIPRHMFQVALQAAVGSKILARENIAPFRKNVIAKCYGGDITRKRKLLEKQKEGKKRMRTIGTVTVPQKAFLAVLNTREE